MIFEYTEKKFSNYQENIIIVFISFIFSKNFNLKYD